MSHKGEAEKPTNSERQGEDDVCDEPVDEGSKRCCKMKKKEPIIMPPPPSNPFSQAVFLPVGKCMCTHTHAKLFFFFFNVFLL